MRRPAPKPSPRPEVLRLLAAGAAQRLGGAALLGALIWAGFAWAVGAGG